ncbi:MAG TPA: beta-propeller domain-containing protein [Polyangiaceae bacterium]
MNLFGSRAGFSVVGFFVLSNCGGAAPSEFGSNDNGGRIIDTTEGNGCTILQVQVPAAWECSAEQIAEAKSGVYPGTGAGVAPPTTLPPAMATSDDVALRTTDCEGLAALRRPALKDAQHTTLDSQRYSLLVSKCLPRTETQYYQNGSRTAYCSTYYPSGGTASGGTSYGGGYAGTGGSSTGGTTATGGSITVAPDDDGADDHSETNVQVAGVDEPDFVKNDSGTIYVLASDGVRVIDAWPAEAAHEVSRVSVVGEPRRMFLAGDRLIVYTRLTSAGQVGLASDTSEPSVPSSQGCTYGYDCRFTSEGGLTLATVFDVTAPESPRELQRIALSGGFVAARRIGPKVYTVVHDQGLVSAPGVVLGLEADDPETLDSEYERLTKAADDAVDALPAKYFLPWAKTVDSLTESVSDADACDEALVTRAAAGQSFVSVVSFDLTTLSGVSRSITAGKPGFVYSSADALYLATDGVDGADAVSPYGSTAADDFSTIHKFSLASGNVHYVGSHPIRGHVLNQFSMDEQNGVLRVATTSGRVPDPSASSNITTLGAGGNGLEKLGELSGLAPDEDIRSVRFDGDRGFVVTFKKTDPLFVIDLADATRPSVLGELKIPGFSTYMQRLDPTHLLAVGFDADDHGDFAYFDGIQIQIFDVSDLANPTLLHKTVIGTRGSGSEALMNHLAFNYFPSRGWLALPMTICEGGDDGVYGDKLTFAGLMVFDVSLEGGIVEHGRLPFVDPAQAAGTGATCGTWWADSTSLVKRSIFMEDFAYGLSDTQLKVAQVDALGDVLETISLR